MGDSERENLTIGQAAVAEPEAPEIPALPEPETPQPSWWEKLIDAETGPGPISSYMNHPINFTADEGGAQLARGLTGIFDNLNRALIDVLVGGFKIWWKHRPAPPSEAPNPHGA